MRITWIFIPLPFIYFSQHFDKVIAVDLNEDSDVTIGSLKRGRKSHTQTKYSKRKLLMELKSSDNLKDTDTYMIGSKIRVKKETYFSEREKNLFQKLETQTNTPTLQTPLIVESKEAEASGIKSSNLRSGSTVHSENLHDTESEYASLGMESPTLLFSENQCNDGLIDLCEDGSSCAGLKQVFLELCFRPDDELTDCTSDCFYLLEQLRKEAHNQRKALECINYLQNVPAKCANEESGLNDEFSHDLQNVESFCPSKDHLTRDLNPGEYEAISCNELYPSGIFGAGSTYRYCMVGGGGAINTNTCVMEDDDMTVPNYGDRMLSSFSVRKLDSSSSIKEGAEKANTILVDTGKVLENAGKAFDALESIGNIAAKLGPAFQAIGVVFSIVNAFLPSGPSPELLYMKEQFRIVNDKLTLLKGQLDDTEDKIIDAVYKSQFSVYKGQLDTCADRLWLYQADPTEGTQKQFFHGCCVGGRSPLNLLNWIIGEMDGYLDNTAAFRNYQMDTFLYDTGILVHSATVASFYESTCLGLYGTSTEEGASSEAIQRIVDKTTYVLNFVENKIKELPNDYINIQLRTDVVKVVAESPNNESCRDNLQSTIRSRMNGWKYSPLPSVYCYNPVSGWNHHGYWGYDISNEQYGFFKEFRINNKFSVGIDWNWTPEDINYDFSRSDIEKRIGDNRFTGILGKASLPKLREIVASHLKVSHGLELRNIAYIHLSNGARWRGYQSTSYFLNINYKYYPYADYPDQFKETMYSIIFSIWPQHGKPSPLLANFGLDPDTTIHKLDLCQGDCDSDAECADGLRCFQRNEGDPGPPGCSGEPYQGYDYCYTPPLDYVGSCNNPMEIGEIRNWADKSQCIDPAGYDGIGEVNTYLCDGYTDQMFQFCEDGTIRSSKSGYCLDVSGHDGLGNVQMWSCEVYPTISEDQQWFKVPIPGVFMESGIDQDLFMIKNQKSGLCLDISGFDGSGAVGIYDCDGGIDQHFYLRNRGEIVDSGKLQNQKSGECLDVSGYDGLGNIQSWKCEDRADQVFTLYENGELVNEASGQCVDIVSYDGHGNIGMYSCQAMKDQQWKQDLWSGDYFSLVNKKSDHCLDVSGYDGKGEIATYRCEDLPDQRWKFIPRKWTTPN